MSDIEIGNDRGSMANRGRLHIEKVNHEETDVNEFLSDNSSSKGDK